MNNERLISPQPESEHEADLRDVILATLEQDLVDTQMTRHEMERRIPDLAHGSEERRLAQVAAWVFGEKEQATRTGLQALTNTRLSLLEAQNLLRMNMSGAQRSRPYRDAMGKILELCDAALGRNL